MLGVAIMVGTARVSVAVVLAVDHSALYSLLDLIGQGKRIQANAFKPPLM